MFYHYFSGCNNLNCNPLIYFLYYILRGLYLQNSDISMHYENLPLRDQMWFYEWVCLQSQKGSSDERESSVSVIYDGTLCKRFTIFNTSYSYSFYWYLTHIRIGTLFLSFPQPLKTSRDVIFPVFPYLLRDKRITYNDPNRISLPFLWFRTTEDWRSNMPYICTYIDTP